MAIWMSPQILSSDLSSGTDRRRRSGNLTGDRPIEDVIPTTLIRIAITTNRGIRAIIITRAELSECFCFLQWAFHFVEINNEATNARNIIYIDFNMFDLILRSCFTVLFKLLIACWYKKIYIHDVIFQLNN